MSKVRVRFAPSPTGGLHIGGVRTALFNYLFAKKNNGDFILRIEDTDQSRYVKDAEAYIMDTLKWCGLQPDESPETGGPHAPYRQSERKEIYQKYAQELLDKDLAYYAFDTPEELEEMRERLKERGVVNLHYNSASRMTMKNSLTLSGEEVKSRMESGEPYVVRVKVPTKEEIRVNDLIRGWVKVHSSGLDDKVILKSDGLPTYHLANIVDDHLMGITHVIRGEEWLPSAPLHVLLYRFLGWEESMPQFAHLPLILKPDGNGKLSKRAAEKAGFPIFPLTWKEENNTSVGFREAGYLPEALINFLALLGWNPGSDKEIFTIQELVKEFSLERVGKAGTKFDIEKAKWFNQQYINQTSNEILADVLMSQLDKAHGIKAERNLAIKISDLLKTRISFLAELIDESLIFFNVPEEYDEKVVSKKWNDETERALSLYSEALIDKSEIDSEEAQELFRDTLSSAGINPGKIMQSLRLSLTGKGSGADLMKIIEIMGPKAASERINYSISTLESMKTN